ELTAEHLRIEHEPRVIMSGARDVLERPERVEAREERRRQPVTVRVEPQSRRAGEDADAVTRPYRREVLNALRVVPHPIEIDRAPAGFAYHLEHASVDVIWNAREHPPRRDSETRRPVTANEVVIPTDPA